MRSPKCNERNGLALLFFMLGVALVVAVCLEARTVYAQFDFNAYLGESILDEEIDGTIGSEWDDAGNYSDTDIDPHGKANIWVKHDETFFYVALQFTADSSNPWVGIQFQRTGHMSSGTDGALFGHDRIGANEYRDISFGGFGSISTDSIQDGLGAIRVGDSNLITVELKKPMNSGDSAGNDIAWTVGSTYSVIIRWDSDGGGSSGGSTSHLGGSTRNRTVLINADAIPEFSVLALFVAMVALSVSAIIIKRQAHSKALPGST